MIIYILFAVFLEFVGAVLRSFFGPLILVDNENLVLPKFTDHYRLIVYSISDVLVGMALLYLFYTQGVLLRQKQQAQSRSLMSLRKFKENSDAKRAKDGSMSTGRRETWEQKLLGKTDTGS